MWYAWDERDSPWKGLQIQAGNEDRHVFNAATRVDLGNGCSASLWSSRWLDGDVPAKMFLDLFKHSKRKNRTMAEALSNNGWVRDVDHNMSQHIIAEF